MPPAGTKDLRIQIDAESAKAEAAIERISRSTMRMEEQLRKADLAAAQLDKQLRQEAEAAAKKRADALDKLGKGLVAFGGATLVGLGMATKAAIDWESAWAGVTKTVDGSPEQMAELEGELRNLATTLPATHREIAAVAEAAGQLGVSRDSIVTFTKTMVDLSETTNLTADEAATSIAQFANIMGTDIKNDVDNLGASLVALGNAGASTEADIVAMSLRLAGAGNLIGASESDVLALASAMSSMGINAEMGGGAMSRILQEIYGASKAGGAELAAFAQVAGMSGQQFAEAWESDPIRAVDSFVKGLADLDASGGDVIQTLYNLGIRGTQETTVMLGLLGANDLLVDSLNLGKTAWEENTALIEEANKRYETTEAKIQIAKNNVVDLAIDVGGVVLPVLAEFLEAGTGIVRFISDLPGPVKDAATVLGILAGTVTAAYGGFLLLAPRLLAARELMSGLAETAPGTARGISAVGKAAGAAAGIGIATTAMWALYEAFKETPPAATDAMEALLNFDDAAKRIALDQLIRQAKDVQKAMDRSWLDVAVDTLTGFGSANIGAKQDVDEFSETLDVFANQLATMVQSGNVERAAEGALLLAHELGFTGAEAEAFIKRLGPYQDALKEVQNENQLTAESLPPINDGLVDLATQFGLTGDDAEKAAQEMLDEWAEASASFVDIIGTYSQGLADKEEAEKTAAQATADSTKSSKDSWEDYLTEVDLTLNEYLTLLDEQVEAQRNWQTNMLILAGRVSSGTLDYLAKLGPEGADLVADLVTATDEQMAHFEENMAAAGLAGGQNWADQLAASREDIQAVAGQLGADAVAKIAEYMALHKVDVRTAAEALGLEIEGALPSEVDVPVTVSGPSSASISNVLWEIRQRLPRSIALGINVTPGNVGGRSAADRGLASGGPVYGPGTGTSDSIPTMLSNGEHVWTAAEVDGMGGHRAVEALRAIALGGSGVGGSARSGGSVSAAGGTMTFGGHVTVGFDFSNAQSDFARFFEKAVRVGEIKVSAN